MPIDQSLFDYDVTPTAVPVSDADGGASSVTLQLLVRNGRDTDIACKSLRIVVPIGPEGGDLTEDPNFEVSEARLTPWSVRAEGVGPS